MKKKILIAVLAVVMVLSGTAMCFAEGGLQIKSSYPENGQTNTSMENLGVKVFFSSDINADEVKKANVSAVKMIDANGKKVPIKVLFSDKKSEGNMMLAVCDTSKDPKKGGYAVLNNSEYKLIIDKSFKDNAGNTLGKTETISFKTYNQKVNNLVNMGLMVVMFGGLMFFSMRSAKNNKTEEEDPKQEGFNPYKEAKRTGKSVDEVKAEHAKQEEKRLKKKAGKKKDEPVYEKKIENCAELLKNVYHVHAPAPTNKQDRSVEALNRMRKEKKAAAKAEAAAKAAKRKKKK